MFPCYLHVFNALFGDSAGFTFFKADSLSSEQIL